MNDSEELLGIPFSSILGIVFKVNELSSSIRIYSISGRILHDNCEYEQDDRDGSDDWDDNQYERKIRRLRFWEIVTMLQIFNHSTDHSHQHFY